ncbi:MAG: flippase [Candidatus Scalinduaceae bacterium]
MKTERSIIRNTAFLSAGKSLGDLCTFFFLVYFARIFGTDILGKYAFAMSLGGLLTVLINLGLNTLMVREVSKDKDQNSKYMGNLLVTQGILAILIWFVIGLISLFSNFSSDTKLILVLISSYHVFYKFTMLFRAEFRAHEEMQYSAFLEISHKVIILLLGIFSIIIWKNPIITLTVYPFSAFSMCILGFIISVSKYGWPDLKVDYVFIKNSLVKAVPFFIIMILAQFYDRIGIILLAYFKEETEVGIFSAADRLLVTIASGVAIFGTVIFPVMSRLFAESKYELFKLYERSVRLMIIVLLPLSTIIFLLSKQIILTFFGDKFIESTPVLQILTWTLLFFGLNCILANLLVVTNHQNRLVKIRIPIYLGYFAVNLALIHKYSFIGLAWAKLFAETFIFLTAYFYVSRIIHNIHIIKNAAAPIMSCLLTALVFYLMDNINLWLKVSSSLIVCVSTMFILKGIEIHDLVFMKRILLSKEG